jgi:hypothetical protein
MKDEEKYEFNLDDPDSWSKMPRPHLSEDFIKETLKIGGLNSHGDPRFKWTWGMSEEVYVEGDQFIQSGWYLKYMLCTTGNRLVGFRWQSDNGKQNFVEDLRKVPPGIMNALPVYRVEQIGTPRWVLEEWREAGDVNGTYDRAGYYFNRWIVADDKEANPETHLKPYREPNQKDLEILAHYVQLTATLTDSDIRQGVKDQRDSEAKAAKDRAAESREEMTETIVEIMHDAKHIDIAPPSKEVLKAAWAKLESRNETRTEQ